MHRAVPHSVSMSRRFVSTFARLAIIAIVQLLVLPHASVLATEPPLVVQQASTSSGSRHACAIFNGAAKCWGYNVNGQLGNGSYLDSAQPITVYGLQSGVTAVAVGGYHTCAIVNGGVKCWGKNADGEVGNGSLDDSPVPAAVQGLGSGVIAIAAGLNHTCAIVTGGSVRCWGWNSDGQLGNNSTNSTGTGAPVSVINVASGATALAAGGYHTCAIVGGNVKCWGYNHEGELDNGSVVSSPVAVVAASLSGVTAISAGLNFNCAIVGGGGVRCWGWNIAGQLGDGTLTSTNAGPPVGVSGISTGATSIAAGGYHACAVVGGAAKCWGYNFFGQLGNSSLIGSAVPVSVTGLSSSVTSIIASLSNTCGQMVFGSNSELKCWGINLDGELGLDDRLYQAVPVPVPAIASGATALAHGSTALHSCAIVNGGAQCWGDNENGELGDGSLIDNSTPAPVSGLTSGVTAITTGVYHSCAVVIGAAKCWGLNTYGQLGNASGTSSSTPVQVSGLTSGVTDISASYWHTCAIVGGTVKCWGQNVNGELGDGSIAVSPVPQTVTGISTAIAIASGAEHTCAILQGGTIKCWGYNAYGQLGNGTTVSTLANPPVTVSGIASGATAIVGGGYHTCAIVNGGVKCWGNGLGGQLGNGGYAHSATPVAVTGLSTGVGTFAAGGGFTCATVGGTVSCWGEFYTLTGTGGIAIHPAPVPIPSLGNVSALGSGYSSACVIVAGAVKCEGTDNFGQLGDGRILFLDAPAFVVVGDHIFSDGFEGN